MKNYTAQNAHNHGHTSTMSPKNMLLVAYANKSTNFKIHPATADPQLGFKLNLKKLQKMLLIFFNSIKKGFRCQN